MARQPVSKKHPETGLAVGHGHENLRLRPKAASLIAECIAAWSEVEFHMGRLLATMLHADSEPTIALYFTLANERAKREAMFAIGEFTLSAKDRDLFQLIMKAKESASKHRTALAHGLYCLVADEPDGIGWISTKDRIKHWSEAHNAEKTLGYANHSSVREFIGVYTLDDLTAILDEIIAVSYVIIHLNLYLSPDTGHYLDEELYLQLSNSPLVTKFQSQIDGNRKNDPSGHE